MRTRIKGLIFTLLLSLAFLNEATACLVAHEDPVIFPFKPIPRYQIEGTSNTIFSFQIYHLYPS